MLKRLTCWYAIATVSYLSEVEAHKNTYLCYGTARGSLTYKYFGFSKLDVLAEIALLP